MPPSYSNLQSPSAAAPPSALSLLQVVSPSSNTQDTLPKLNSSKTKAIPRLIIDLLEHLGPGFPTGQALSRTSHRWGCWQKGSRVSEERSMAGLALFPDTHLWCQSAWSHFIHRESHKSQPSYPYLHRQHGLPSWVLCQEGDR